ncbi:flagellar hook-associated protein FlgK [Bacillus dakarensis]|uniref:flagellar hook-associated protein FlgK n=1 Tax=Robertmurraya dakarensis TaxID=1926278 RepID=UPI0009825D92|nr:flagellar hook-associated protein FlgK [Bacillus dakarensis]
MVSTFHGLEVAKRGMYAQQTALSTVGHNVANANTPGYTRQRVDFQTTTPFPTPSLNRPQIPGQLGTGVEAGAIERVRDSFIDSQYRGENNKLGYWETKSQALSSLEVIMNEPTEQGLANTLDEFWQSLQNLSVSPQDSGTRSVVRQSGQSVAETFNYLSNSLSAVREDYRAEIDVTQKSVNTIIGQINEINQQIAATEVHGYLPNDLYDQRDLLVDDLSSYVNIIVKPQDSGGLSVPSAVGKYDIYLADQNGIIMKDGSGNDLLLVNSRDDKVSGIQIDYDANSVKGVKLVEMEADGQFMANEVNIDVETYLGNANGSLRAYIEAYGYQTGGTEKGIYTDMISNLDAMATTFAKKFNEIHQAGWSLSELKNGVKESKTFFDLSDPASIGASKAISLHRDIISSVDNIAASGEQGGESYSGSGANALALANLKDEMLNYAGTDTSVTSFYQSLIGDMGVQALQANQMTDNTNILRDSVLTRRESVSSVSLDEEMVNMIQYQHAYNAAARQITMVDEMLDRIINGMGVGGR